MSGRYGVWCEPYWSPRFGRRHGAWLKHGPDSVERPFDTLEEAQAEAERLNASAFGQHADYQPRERIPA